MVGEFVYQYAYLSVPKLIYGRFSEVRGNLCLDFPLAIPELSAMLSQHKPPFPTGPGPGREQPAADMHEIPRMRVKLSPHASFFFPPMHAR